MLDANLKAQLQTYLQKVTRPIEIAVWLDDSPKSAEMKALVDEIAPLSAQIRVAARDDAQERRPSFAIGTPGEASIFTERDRRKAPWVTPERFAASGCLDVWQEAPLAGRRSAPPPPLDAYPEGVETFRWTDRPGAQEIRIGWRVIPPGTAIGVIEGK